MLLELGERLTALRSARAEHFRLSYGHAAAAGSKVMFHGKASRSSMDNIRSFPTLSRECIAAEQSETMYADANRTIRRSSATERVREHWTNGKVHATSCTPLLDIKIETFPVVQTQYSRDYTRIGYLLTTCRQPAKGRESSDNRKNFKRHSHLNWLPQYE